MKLKYNFAIQKVCGFFAAVPVGEDAKRCHSVISVNETAGDMLQFLHDDITEEQLVQRMLETYEVSEEVLRPQVTEFIQKLREAGVLVE